MVIRVLKSVQSAQSVVKKIFASFERDLIEPFVSFVQFVFIKSLLQHLNTTLPQ